MVRSGAGLWFEREDTDVSGVTVDVDTLRWALHPESAAALTHGPLSAQAVSHRQMSLMKKRRADEEQGN